MTTRIGLTAEVGGCDHANHGLTTMVTLMYYHVCNYGPVTMPVRAWFKRTQPPTSGVSPI